MVSRTCILVVALGAKLASGTQWSSFDTDWKFNRGASGSGAACQNLTAAFPVDLGDTRCKGLRSTPTADAAACAAACCALGASCQTWQWCAKGEKCAQQTQGCWIGAEANCDASDTSGWLSRARASTNGTSGQQPCDTPYCERSFDDSSWRALELPHDWSSEDLPARAVDADTPVLEARNGSWKFSPGDNASWAAPGFNDGGWGAVTVPHDWRDAPTSYVDRDAYGWYRRTVAVGAAQLAAAKAGTLQLALGTVALTDEAFVNGVKVGGTGSMGKGGGCGALAYRSYNVPYSVLASAVAKNGGSAVVAVRVWSQGGAPGATADGQAPGGLFDSEAPDERVGMFDPAASPGQKSTGYSVGGEGWYRKDFVAPASACDDCKPNGNGATCSEFTVQVKFDGVYMNSDVWLNGKLLGSRPYGYVTFAYDLSASGALLPAPATNSLAVRVRNGGRNSRWYSGSGIYRHVWLGTTRNVHVPMWSLQVHTPAVDVAKRSATVALDVQVGSSEETAFQDKAAMVATIYAPDGKTVAATATKSVDVGGGAPTNVSFSFDLAAGSVSLWDTSSPALYSATVSVDGGATVDASTTFGIRHLEFTATGGFKLNGVPTKLQGGCVHHDNGPLGAAAIDRADERRVEVLKAAGYNAIRTSHNPVSPAFLDACDRLGMLVMDEAFDCWSGGKNPQDYHLYFDAWWQRDMEAMVLRDRNHPSIIMWSIGNEIPIRNSPLGVTLSKQLADFIRARDASARPVTSAYPGVSNAADAYFAPLDVAGYNYGWDKYAADHARVPDRIIVGTESFPAQSFQNWDLIWNSSYLLGDFIWTAMDYIGESSIGANGRNTPDLQACGGYCPRGWAYHIAYCGDIDLVGHRKPQSIYRNVLWNNTQLEVAVHAPVPAGQHEVIASWGFADERQSWTWDVAAADPPLSVNVYSQYPHVQLLLNGKPADAAQASPVAVSRATEFKATFSVPYAAGELTAVAFGPDGAAVAKRTLFSAGAPAGIVLRADRAAIAASRDDLSYVTATVVDKDGKPTPSEDTTITFSLDGGANAEIAAVGSGDPQDSGSFHAASRKTYRGKAVAIVRPGKTNIPATAGSATLTASAPGLGAGTTLRITYE